MASIPSPDRRRRFAVVGGGPAGMTAAILLRRQGHQVDVFDAPGRPTGAGLLLQHLGQQVLSRLGVLDELAAVSARVTGVDARTHTGRVVMDFRYADADRRAYGLGVSRGRLRGVLNQLLEAEGEPVRAATVHRVDGPPGRLSVRSDRGSTGPYELVIGADGAGSRLRADGFAGPDRAYRWGAVWALAADPEGLAHDTLVQRYRGTRVTLGFLPVGSGQTVVFWSVPVAGIDALVAAPQRLAALALPHAGRFAPLVERAAAGPLLPARYRDVRVAAPVRDGQVLIGDAAHATSPQLGAGASLALADAWTLADAIGRTPDSGAAAAEYAAARAANTRYYRWASKLLTPVFQSSLTPLGPVRDLVFGPASRIPYVRRQMVTTLMGHRTSPWGTFELPG